MRTITEPVRQHQSPRRSGHALVETVGMGVQDWIGRGGDMGTIGKPSRCKMTDNATSADVVVVGGGIVGAFTADYLAKAGTTPLIIDERPGEGASAGNAGVLALSYAPQNEYRNEPNIQQHRRQLAAARSELVRETVNSRPAQRSSSSRNPSRVPTESFASASPGSAVGGHMISRNLWADLGEHAHAVCGRVCLHPSEDLAWVASTVDGALENCRIPGQE
ncbi:FAD-dependent oxidoreductase [Rhodococcus sp. WS4]|nr:FAD-dependent oxidoreductase [Rhodococcus sp. WS4]